MHEPPTWRVGGIVVSSVTTPPPPRNPYLVERPSTRTAPPADDRMAKVARWTVWTLRKQEGNRKPSKVPIANPTDPSTWNYFHACRACLADEKIAGLGFEMYGRPGIVGVDIDNCIDEVGQKTSLAQQFLAILEAAGGKFHVEISPSGKGLRIFAAETPLPFHDYTNKDTGVEVYSGEAGRFLAFTGARVPGFGEGPFHPLPQDAITFLGKHAQKWKEGAKGEVTIPETNGEPIPELKRRDDWRNLHPNAVKRLSKENRDFMETGALGRKYASASEQLFAVEQMLLKHLKPPQVYQLLISAEGSWGVALEHREGSEAKARDFIWQDIQRAALSKERYELDKAASASGWKDCDIIVELTDDGAKAKILQLNVINAFKKHAEWINRLGYNTFDGRVTLDKQDVGVEQLAEMSAWLCEFLKWQYEPHREIFEEAVTAAAKSRPWNPIEDELRALVWDGKNRVQQFTEAVVKDPEALDFLLMTKWLVGFVARGLTPGCQMDTVLCLHESAGGGYKTTFARVMAGSQDRFSDSPSFGSDKDNSMLRVGMRIVELGEGVAVRKADKAALKLDLTKLDDHYRPPWGRMVERRPRGFVYIMTVNEQAFLRSDQDGLRRIWPVAARDIIDIEWIKENRDQLLAQAVALHTRGVKWWWDKNEEPKELRERQTSAVAEDFADNAVESILADKENKERGYTTLSEVKRQIEGIVGYTLNSTQAQHLLDVLGKHGFTSGRRFIDGRQLRVWFHPSWHGGVPARIIPMRKDRDDGGSSSGGGAVGTCDPLS